MGTLPDTLETPSHGISSGDKPKGVVFRPQGSIGG